MALNTEFPAWMQQQTRDDTAAGVAIGRNLLEGFRLQQEQIRHEAEAPVRAAQLEAYRAQTQANVNRAAAEAFSLKQQMAGQGKMADALKFSSDLMTSGGYTNPDNRIRFYDFLSKNPELAPTPWAEQQNKLFETADDFERKKVELQSVYQRNIDVANIRATAAEKLLDQRAEDQKELLEAKANLKVDQATLAAKSDEELRAMGKTEDEIAGLRNTQPGAYRMNQARSFVENTARSLEPFGVKLTDGERSELTARYLSGVQATQAPLDIVKSVNNEGSGMVRLNNLLDRINKIGPEVFDKAVGPIDTKTFNWKLKFSNPSLTTAQDKELRAIIQEANFVIQAYRNKQFGSALTEQEMERFKEIAGDTSNRDYSNQLATFRDSLRNSLKESLESYKLAPNIPTRWKAMLLFDSPTQSTVPQGTTAPSGEVIEFDVNPDGTVIRRR